MARVRSRRSGSKAVRQKKAKVTDVVIGIQPIGMLDEKHVAVAEQALRSYGFSTIRLSTTSYPPWINVRRERVFSNELTGWLTRFRSSEITHVVGLIQEPIRTTDCVIIGLSSDFTCVISLDELRSEVGLRSVVLHEVGHLFGLFGDERDPNHCSNELCVMNSDADPDVVGDWFCPDCRSEFIRAVGWTPFLRRQGIRRLKQHKHLLVGLVAMILFSHLSHLNSPIFLLAASTYLVLRLYLFK